jgi:membrane protein DedA with SNARE-associated domain
MDVAGIAAGALRMPLPRFLVACLAGKTVRFIGLAWVGSFLASSGIM